jgi:hypothetical protein
LSASAPEPAPSPRLYRALKRVLDREGSDRAAVIVALLLLCFSLDTGLSADDYVHELIARGSDAIPGFVRAPWDMYRFADTPFTTLLMREGVLGWWEDPEAKLAFFRPLSALTHMLDSALWPHSGVMMHLHTLLWAALLYAGVLALNRALVMPPFVAALSTFIYVFDDARGWIGSWVAARNAVIATALSVWALVLHHRARQGGGKLPALAAPVLLVLALLAGEGAIAICGYLLAYALFLDHGTLRTRVMTLLPYAAVVLPWRVVWRAMGYGVSHSGLYFDPISEPLGYLGALAERAPVLLSSQLGGAWSDIWNILFAFPAIESALYVGACLLLLFFGYALMPVLRHDPVVRFAVLGALLSVLPASAAFPADRLLTWVAIGGSIAVARLLAAFGEDREWLSDTALRALILPPLVLALLVAKAVIDPVFMPSRARGNLVIRDNLDRAQATVPIDASIIHKRIVYVNPPGFPLAGYIPIERAALGQPRARSQVVLATGEADLRIERVDEFSLRVRQRGGFLQSPGSHLFRNPKRTFTRGTNVELEGVNVVIDDLTAEGRPAAILARFDRTLEDPSLVFLAWEGLGYVPFALPAVGQSVILPALDLAAVLLGDTLTMPIDGRLPPVLDPHFVRQ